MKKTCVKILVALVAPWTSKRFWMTIIGLIMFQSLFWPAVFYLYSFTQQWMAEIFFKMFALIVGSCNVAILGFLGFQSFGNGVSSGTADSIQKIIGSKTENE